MVNKKKIKIPAANKTSTTSLSGHLKKLKIKPSGDFIGDDGIILIPKNRKTGKKYDIKKGCGIKNFLKDLSLLVFEKIIHEKEPMNPMIKYK